MDGVWVGPLLMSLAAVLFCLAAVFAVRAVARLALAAPELERKVAELSGHYLAMQAQIAEALELAESARRASLRRERKKRSPTPTPTEEADRPAPGGPRRWIPGETGTGEVFDAGDAREEAAPYPVELLEGGA